MMPHEFQPDQPWQRFELDIRVNGRTFTWTRYAPNAVHLIVEAQAACAREWPLDTSEIVAWRAV